MFSKTKGLYVITDDVLTPKEEMLIQVEKALKGGAKIVQLRDKKSSDEELEKELVSLQKLCRRYKALFVLNDRVELAIKHQCDGLHIGKSDHHRVSEIRKNYWGYLGISCYGDLQTAKKMQKLGADYVAFGSFFTSSTKPQAEVIDKDIVKEAKKALDIPICAIGGITSSNAKELVENGIDMLAVISDIWKSEDISKKCAEYKELLAK